jgi:uncharacterized protein
MKQLETPHGPARVHVHEVDDPRAALVLGHGAGGGVESPDLQGAAKAALEAGLTVALVEQPYRVAGRRSPAPAHQLDAAWTSVLDRLRGDELAGLRFVTGGRSAGARVACRTAQATGAVRVLCLAFPLHPPGRPLLSRLGELDVVRVPVLVVQGSSDPFGMPPPGPNREVVAVRGNHSLRADVPALRTAVREWLRKQGAA